MNDLNEIELSAILYYADYLSILAVNHPITDNCKYFFVHNTPVNVSFIVNNKPFYDENSQFFKQSIKTYNMLVNKFGEDGAMSFYDNLCNLSACGCVSAVDMLRCVHQYDSKFDKQLAMKDYSRWRKQIKYSHLKRDEDGKFNRVECSKYVAHTELSEGAITRPQLHMCNELHEIEKQENR